MIDGAFESPRGFSQVEETQREDNTQHSLSTAALMQLLQEVLQNVTEKHAASQNGSHDATVKPTPIKSAHHHLLPIQKAAKHDAEKINADMKAFEKKFGLYVAKYLLEHGRLPSQKEISAEVKKLLKGDKNLQNYVDEIKFLSKDTKEFTPQERKEMSDFADKIQNLINGKIPAGSSLEEILSVELTSLRSNDEINDFLKNLESGSVTPLPLKPAHVTPIPLKPAHVSPIPLKPAHVRPIPIKPAHHHHLPLQKAAKHDAEKINEDIKAFEKKFGLYVLRYLLEHGRLPSKKEISAEEQKLLKGDKNLQNYVNEIKFLSKDTKEFTPAERKEMNDFANKIQDMINGKVPSGSSLEEILSIELTSLRSNDTINAFLHHLEG